MTETYFDGENELTVDYNHYPNGDIESKSYLLNEKLHRKDGPARIEYYIKDIKHNISYYYNGLLHRTDGPALEIRFCNGTDSKICYYHNGLLHRTDGPAIIKYDSFSIIETNIVNGIFSSPSVIKYDVTSKKIIKIKYLKPVNVENTSILHRLDGPAIFYYYGNGNIHLEEYFVENKRHRLDGPSLIEYYENGNIRTEEYKVNGKRQRLDGPAIISYYDNGDIKKEEFWVNDKLHRLDGPALICYYEDGNIEKEKYWINGEEIDTEQFPDINLENWPLSLEDQLLLKMSV